MATKERHSTVTILDLALHRGAHVAEDGTINGAEFEKVGLAILGGCEACGASIAAYNAFPSKSGFWRCRSCIDGDGWVNVAKANDDIFGAGGTGGDGLPNDEEA